MSSEERDPYSPSKCRGRATDTGDEFDIPKYLSLAVALNRLRDHEEWPLLVRDMRAELLDPEDIWPTNAMAWIVTHVEAYPGLTEQVLTHIRETFKDSPSR